MNQTREMSNILVDSSFGPGLSGCTADFFFWLILQVDIGVKQSWIKIPSPPLTSSVNLGKLLDVSELDCPHL